MLSFYTNYCYAKIPNLVMSFFEEHLMYRDKLNRQKKAIILFKTDVN